MKHFQHILILFVILSAGRPILWAQSKKSFFSVQLDSSAGKPLSGRLYIFSSTDTSKGVQDPDPFNPSPTFLLDVTSWMPGEIISVDSTAAAYPIKMNSLKPGNYKFAAIFDIDTQERNNTLTPGNWYSRDVLVQVNEKGFEQTHILLNRKMPARPFRETSAVRQEIFKSKLVTDFRKRDSYIKAAVVLPKDYDSSGNMAYPVVFIIPGWGGTHYDVINPAMQKRYGIGLGIQKIYVYLNPETNNPFGLHAFIDSRVNGPWGKTLVNEFIPYIIKKYKIESNRQKHFVVGQSSGGYAALWLQLNYPMSFGGCWAVSPDPVDFSDFTSVNIYERDANFYYDKAKSLRPFFEMNGQYLATIKGYAQFEDFLGDGGQMQSFEAAFGTLDKKTGKPAQLFNRATGFVNSKVVDTWKPYDMSLFVENNHKELQDKVAGKVHVYAGAQDNFFLNRSVNLFKQKIESLNFSRATVELIVGANHWTIWSEDFTKRVQQEIDGRVNAVN
jgi:S-formylglutathione hydrolase FrmB